MRFSPSICLLGVAIVLSTTAAALSQDTTDQAARWSARRDLALAKMELRHYWQVEYPRRQRELNAAIELTEAEVRAYRERILAYRPFDRFSLGQPFLVTLQEEKLCLREAELRLRNLWAERNDLIRFHSDQWRLLEARLFEARMRVAELEAHIEPVDAEQSEEELPRVAANR